MNEKDIYMSKYPKTDKEFFEWYVSLLKIMDYGDEYELKDEKIIVRFNGLYSRTRTTIYNAFLFKYGLAEIINRRLPDIIDGMSFETIINLKDIHEIRDKLVAHEKDILW